MQIPEPRERPLLKPTEAAELLGCSVSSVYRMIRQDELPTIRLGGGKSTRVVTAELRRLLGLDAQTGGQ